MEGEEKPVEDNTADLETQEETQEDPNTPKSEETSEETPTASSETEETPTGEEPASDEAPTETPVEEEEAADLDEETLEALAEAYEDGLLKTKRLKGRVTKSIKEEVARQVRDHVSTVDSQSKVEQFISQGDEASKKMGALVTAAKEELGKASRSEEFSADVLNSQEFVEAFHNYGASTAQYERHVLETATQEGFDQVFGNALPTLSDDQSEELNGIANTRARMQGDQRQSAKADKYWLTELLNFVAQRGIEHGATQEGVKLASKKTVRDKIAGTNAVKAAKASLEKGKTPPRTQKSDPRSVGVEYSEEGYQKIKQTNDPVKIQDYVNGWMRKRQKVAG